MKMNSIKIAWVFIGSLFLSSNIEAQWSHEGIRQIEEFNDRAWQCLTEPAHNCKNVGGHSYFATMIGHLLGEALSADASVHNMIIRTAKLSSPAFVALDGSVQDLKLWHWRPPGLSLHERRHIPLIIYLPGLFQDASSADTIRMAQAFLKLGYQVLVVPNSFSSGYLEQHPIAPPGAFQDEADVVLGVVRWARQHLVSHQTRLDLFGTSYGAFLAARAVGMEAAVPNLKQLVNGQVTLVSPPMNMGRAVRILDRYINLSEGDLFFGVSANPIGLKIHDELVSVVQRLQRRYFEEKQSGHFSGINTEPTIARLLGQLDFNEPWAKHRVRFRWLVEALEFPAQKTQYEGHEDALPYWLAQAVASGFERFRILTTDDDFLNETVDLEELPAILQKPQHLLVRRTGGHAGYLSQNMFEQFLRTQF